MAHPPPRPRPNSAVAAYDPEPAPARPQAACIGIPTSTFFPDRYDAATLAAARKVCRSCPLIEPCAEWGIRHEMHGVWGGLSERQREHARAKRGLTNFPPVMKVPVVLGKGDSRLGTERLIVIADGHEF